MAPVSAGSIARRSFDAPASTRNLTTVRSPPLDSDFRSRLLRTQIGLGSTLASSASPQICYRPSRSHLESNQHKQHIGHADQNERVAQSSVEG